MNKNEYTVTRVPELPHKSVSWNPDAIDVTVNPNKGRKITTENQAKISTSTENDRKKQVFESNDYQKWLQQKNSFLNITTSRPTTTTTRSTTKRRPLVYTTAKPVILDMLAGGSQTPELEIQHEMNHFPDFPIPSSTTKRVPREFMVTSSSLTPTASSYYPDTERSDIDHHFVPLKPTGEASTTGPPIGNYKIVIFFSTCCFTYLIFLSLSFCPILSKVLYNVVHIAQFC